MTKHCNQFWTGLVAGIVIGWICIPSIGPVYGKWQPQQQRPGNGSLSKPRCLLSELECNNGKCVSLNRYCDAINHCGDSTDEPPHCTPCNRTYYGEVGITYDLELHRPRMDKVPYYCHITLAAGGGRFGDIVQVTMERFTLGRFNSFLRDGCPDGWLTMREGQRSQVGGAWCGTSWGPVVYFSETNTLIMSLTLLTLASSQNGYNFDFKISFKMLTREEAVVRFGIRHQNTYAVALNESYEESNSIEDDSSNTTLSLGAGSSGNPPVHPHEYFLGNQIGLTYCSRMFSNCDRRECRLQSPNFPGVYPRNLTCYYAVRQQTVPDGKHALITVYQPEAGLVNIRSQSTLYARPTLPTQTPNRTLKVWTECDEVQDYVTVYDGYTTRDPVLLKFCGGGTAIPKIVSSGPMILVEFATSPYGTFLYPAPPHPLHGFQLIVKVDFVDKDSTVYTRNKRCEFWISGTGHGVIESPRNTLSPNSTCLYHLWGAEPGTTPPPRPHPRPPRYKVWISILKYHVADHLPNSTADAPCSASLKIWDGSVKSTVSCDNPQCDKTRVHTVGRHAASLLGHYCRDQVPRSCDRHLLRNVTRPCRPLESYLTTSDTATLELSVEEATSLKPVYFKALYEFVDQYQDGDQETGGGPCARVFASKQYPSQTYYVPHHFASPRNIFLYGRGGATNLSCTYRFEAQSDERVRITLTNIRAGNRTNCETQNEGGLGRLVCVGNPTAYLQFNELVEVTGGGRSRLAKDCLCSGAESHLPFVYTSASRGLTVAFNVFNMTPSDDYSWLGFEATWEFVKRPVCNVRQILSGSSGKIEFISPSTTPQQVNCEGKPWVIEPTESHYLYVKMKGIVVGGSFKGVVHGQCATSNRVEIHSGKRHVIVCPEPLPRYSSGVVEVFSEGWVVLRPTDRLPPGWSRHDVKETRNVVVDFSPREPGSYHITWLELSRRRSEAGGLTADCAHKCPELDACINSSLWCDGVNHCPSGEDESFAHCLPLPPVQLGLLAIIILSAASLVTTLLCRLRSKPSTRQYHHHHHAVSVKSLPSDTDTIVSSSGKVC